MSNDLVLDLITGTRAYEIFQAPAVQERASTSVSIGLTRIAIFHLVIALSKWVELYDHYKAVLPEDVRTEAKALRKEIRDRGVVEFRNKIVGHVWDKDHNRPVRTDEAMD